MAIEFRQRVKEVLDQALDLESTDRARYLDEACNGNHAVRREVESLLAEENGASGP